MTELNHRSVKHIFLIYKERVLVSSLLSELSKERRLVISFKEGNNTFDVCVYNNTKEYNFTFTRERTFSRQIRHFFTLGAQTLQQATCPQGLKSISRLPSEHTRHSSIAADGTMASISCLKRENVC